MTERRITLANRQGQTFLVDHRKPLLDSLKEQGVDLPYGCKYDGYVILCVARPVTDCVIEVGVDSHDKLYRNPFLDPLAAHELKADIARPLEEKQ